MATLYLHIGTPKTGTTAIQHFCVNNIETLARLGYCLPRMPVQYPGIGYERNAHFMTKLAVRGDDGLYSASNQRTWKRCMDCLSAKFRRYSNVLLFDEVLCDVAMRGMQDLWERVKRESEERSFDVRFVIYLRRQDQYLISRRGQAIRGTGKDLAIYNADELITHAHDRVPMDYYEMLERIATYFGREAITVRIYDRDRFEGGDVQKDFIRAIGLPTDVNYEISNDLNRSLNANMLEIKRIINAMPTMDQEALQRVGSFVLSCNKSESAGEKYSIFSDEQLRAFLDRYEESNRKLGRDYLGIGEVSPFAPPEPQPPKWNPYDTGMYESIVRFFATVAFLQEPKRPLKTASHAVRRRLGRMRRAIRLWRIERDLRPERHTKPFNG